MITFFRKRNKVSLIRLFSSRFPPITNISYVYYSVCLISLHHSFFSPTLFNRMDLYYLLFFHSFYGRLRPNAPAPSIYSRSLPYFFRFHPARDTFWLFISPFKLLFLFRRFFYCHVVVLQPLITFEAQGMKNWSRKKNKTPIQWYDRIKYENGNLPLCVVCILFKV